MGRGAPFTLNVTADLGGVALELTSRNATLLRASFEGRGGLEELELLQSREAPVHPLPVIVVGDGASVPSVVQMQRNATSVDSAAYIGAASSDGDSDADAAQGSEESEDSSKNGDSNALLTLAAATAVALGMSAALCYSARRSDAPKQQGNLTRLDVPMSPLTMNAGLGLPRRSTRRVSARRRLAASTPGQ